jgi:hypothetical protein
MLTVSAFVLTALAACSVSAQDAKETQPPGSTQLEEIVAPLSFSRRGA